jgi:hypothetical protein
MIVLVVVRGVGGAVVVAVATIGAGVGARDEATEAMEVTEATEVATLFLSNLEDAAVVDASSAAFRFRVTGGMMAVLWKSIPSTGR